MSKKKSGPKPSSTMSNRERLRAERLKRQEAARRREKMLRIGIGVGVALVIIAIVVVVQMQRSQLTASGDDGVPYPKTAAKGFVEPKSRVKAIAAADEKVAQAEAKASKKGASQSDKDALAEAKEERANLRGMWRGVSTGKADAPVVVELFEDFSCPHCGDFMKAGVNEVLEPFIEDGTARVVFYPMTMDQFTPAGTQYAANAFGCAVEEGKGTEYEQLLFENQQVWDHDVLIDLGEQIGLNSPEFKACVKSERFYAWQDSIDAVATDRKVNSTPTVIVNGKKAEGASIGELVEDMKSQIIKAGEAARSKTSDSAKGTS